MKAFGAAFCSLALLCLGPPPAAGTQRVVGDTPRRAGRLLGVGLGAEVSAWLEEVERRLGQEVYAEFAELDPEDAGGDYTLGTSYLTRAGVGVVRVDESFRGRGEKLTEAAIGHELLHLRLRARGYPLFLFAPEVKTLRGPAEDAEQPNVNDLVSMIEHRVFAPEMRRTGFDKLIDLTSYLASARRLRGSRDGQATQEEGRDFVGRRQARRADGLGQSSAVGERARPAVGLVNLRQLVEQGRVVPFERGARVVEDLGLPVP